VNKTHAPHPTQHAACGAPHYVHVTAEPTFRALPEHRKCKRCSKVLEAADAGRPVFSGYEDPETGERGARVVK